MNISSLKMRTPLGTKLFAIEAWQRVKIKSRLKTLGVSEGQWRGIHERVDAHKLPVFIRDVIVEELPETENLFSHPELADVQ